MPTLTNMTALVWAAAIVPSARKLIALRLAELHDRNEGLLSASMAALADQAGMSANAARRHVHALIDDSIVSVVANAHGGAPGAARHYRFNVDVLRSLAAGTAQTADLFDAPAELAAADVPPAGSLMFVSSGGVAMRAELIGAPGHRGVTFTRLASDDRAAMNYGTVPIADLLTDSRAGSWHGHLSPNGDPDCEFELYVVLEGEVLDQIAQWVQNAALGRVESMATV